MVEPVVQAAELLALQDLVRRLPASEEVERYAVRLARGTRPGPDAIEPVNRWVQWGAGPRASQHLALGARVWAALQGNEVPHLDDVRAIARSVLGHRVLLNFEADAHGVGVDEVIDELVDHLAVRGA